jgi:DNA (cytosine-5)-methyltransferase 1
MRDRAISSENTSEALAEREEIQRCHVDVIAGGFPCQDLSRASATASGFDGKRSGLWWEMLRIVRLVRPKYVIVKNVAAILDGERMGTFLGSLAAAGFDAEWDCLQAKEFGAPHKRDRFFALAYANKVDGEAGLGNKQNGTPPVFAGCSRERNEFWVQTPCPSDRVDDGVSAGLYADRVGGLGNAVVPQVAEWIGRRIIEADARMK